MAFGDSDTGHRPTLDGGASVRLSNLLGTIGGVLVLSASIHDEILSHLLAGLPDEACGLIGGRRGIDGAPDVVDSWYPSVNIAESSRVYTIDPKTHFRADRDAEDRGSEIIGVVHSHTHSEPVPSLTDISQAPDPTWHYIIVSFRLGSPMLHSWRIEGDYVLEEPVSVRPG